MKGNSYGVSFEISCWDIAVKKKKHGQRLDAVCRLVMIHLLTY